MSPKPSDVVVTGIGAVTSIGIGIDAFWPALRDGISGIKSFESRDDGGPKPPPNWRQSSQAGHWIGGPVIGFDAAQFVKPRKALKVMGRELQTAFAASQMAMEQAGLPAAIESGAIAHDQVATIFGSQILYGPASELLDAIKNSMDDAGQHDITKFGSAAMRDIMPLWMLKYLPNMAACHVGIAIGATGPNNTIVAGDVSATSAMMESIGALQRGTATAVVCGATGSRIDETYLIFRGDAPLPTVPSDISQASRPHAVDSDGVIFAEAATSVIVERRASASARGVKPMASIVGHAARFMKPETGKRGSAGSMKLAIDAALQIAGLSASDIGLVISHGMGDPLRDESEREVLLNTLPGVPLCMPIALTGHCGAATGGIHMIAAALALQHKTIPATPPYVATHPMLKDRCFPKARPLAKQAVIVLTHNSHGPANAIVMRSEDHLSVADEC